MTDAPDITLDILRKRLDENGLYYTSLPLQNNILLAILARGGRLLGPFLPDGQSVGWLSPRLSSAEAFRRFLDAEEWNIGGNRTWIAPEIQFSVADRSRFWETIRIPAAMDPEPYVLEPGAGCCVLHKTVELPVFYPGAGTKRLAVRRHVFPAADPLRERKDYASLVDGVLYAGYEHDIKLTDLDGNSFMAESWDLFQVKPGGTAYVKVYDGESTQGADYYEKVDAAHQTIAKDHIALRITGDRRYKLGFPASCVTGRIGYLAHSGSESTLVARQFFSNPSAPYNEEPPLLTGTRGLSVHVYNDSGELGGFGEIETNGQAVGGTAGRSASADQFITWMYRGACDKVERISRILIGCP